MKIAAAALIAALIGSPIFADETIVVTNGTKLPFDGIMAYGVDDAGEPVEDVVGVYLDAVPAGKSVVLDLNGLTECTVVFVRANVGDGSVETTVDSCSTDPVVLAK